MKFINLFMLVVLCQNIILFSIMVTSMRMFRKLQGVRISSNCHVFSLNPLPLHFKERLITCSDVIICIKTTKVNLKAETGILRHLLEEF